MLKDWMRLSCGLLLCLAWGTSQAVSDGTVRIALVGDFSGSYADVGGQGAAVAAEMAIDSRQREAAGAPVELVTVNTRGDRDGVVDTLAGRHRDLRIDAVITLDDAATAHRVREFAIREDMVFIHSGAATRELAGEHCAPSAFQWVPPMYAYASGVRDGLADRGVDTWFFLASGEGEGAQVRHLLEEVFSIATSNVIGIAEYEPGWLDMEPFVEVGIATGADVIALADPGSSTVAALGAAYEMGLTPRAEQVAAMQLTLSDVRRLGLYVTGGLRLVLPFIWNADSTAEAWSRRFHERAGTMPTAIQASTYSAVGHYLDAVEAVGSDRAEPVASQMRSREVNDVYARNGAQIWGNGQLVKDMYFAEIKRSSQSREAWDYFTVIDSFPAGRVFPVESLERDSC